MPPEFLRELRALCSEREVALILDEIQCGVGRTGRLFAFEESGITPDLLTLAKPLGGGLPIGAVVAAPHIAAAMNPGEHGTTFGGGPFVASVALAVLRTIADPAFLEEVHRKAVHLERGLAALAGRHSRVVETRGRGLMRGVQLDGPVVDVVTRAREEGLFLVGAGPDVIRLLPPLVVTTEEIDRALEILDRVLAG